MIQQLQEERTMLTLIDKKMSVNEIKKKMKLLDNEFMAILNRIKFNYKIRYIFYSDGTIRLERDEFIFKERNIRIIQNSCKTNKKIKIGVISDLHVGSIFERIDLLNIFYQYCKANNINIVFNGGDLLDGNIGLSDKIFDDPLEQINHLLASYPFDKSILNFICLGNHDESLFKSYSLEIDRILKNNRIDLIPVDYGYSRIYISDKEFISMVHEDTPVKKLYNKDRDKVILYGHTHQFNIKDDQNQLNVYIPPLCGIPVTDNICPGFLILNVYLEDECISKIIIEYHTFVDDLNKKSEFIYKFKGRQLVKK